MESRFGSAINYNSIMVLKDIYKKSSKENISVMLLDTFQDGILTIIGNYKNNNLKIDGFLDMTLNLTIKNLKINTPDLILVDVCGLGLNTLDHILLDEELNKLPIVYFSPTSVFIHQSLMNLRWSIKEERITILNRNIQNIKYISTIGGMLKLDNPEKWMYGLAAMAYLL
jgi:hypothetical protein